MTSQDNLTVEEADMLLFLADELGPQERAAFEMRLKADRAFAERFAELRDIDGRLQSADVESATNLFVSDRALKSSLRLVREQVLLRNQCVVAPGRFRVPPYAIAAGIAIVFTLGFIGWLYTTPPVVITPAPVAQNNPSSIVPGNSGFPPGGGLSSAFLQVGVDQYGDSSREIDQEIDALSMLADFEEGPESN